MDGTIRNLYDLVSIAAQKQWGTQCWFRGQGDASWKLLPSLFRLGHGAKTQHVESNMCNYFVSRAETRYHGLCPPLADRGAWLCLMQHYRLPTRMLDWTESPLIAAHFAVWDQPDGVSSAIAVLAPQRMNEQLLGVPRIEGVTSDRHGAFKAAFAADAEDGDKVVACHRREFDVRHLVQQAAFTVHCSPKPLESYPETVEFLRVYEIPPDARDRIRQELALAGITEEGLFPDLEHLSRSATTRRWSV